MDRFEMAHRWCNCDFGKKGEWRNAAAHVRCDETHFYSYSTVYAMWLDKTPGKKLMVIMDKGCSVTSSDHLRVIRQAIPKDVKYIETHLPPWRYWIDYKNVDFSYYHWQTKLPQVLLGHILENIKPFADSKTIKTRDNLRTIQKIANDVNWLYDNRKDCKVSELTKGLDKGLKTLFKSVRKQTSAEELVDIVLGKGTYAAYEARLTPQLKAEKTRRFVAWFNKTHNSREHQFTKSEIKKMPIAEKVLRACLPPLEKWERNRNDWWHISESNKNLAKYLLGDTERLNSDQLRCSSNIVINRFTGKKYSFFEYYSGGLYWKLNYESKSFVCDIMCSKGYDVPFIVFEDYKKSKDKDQWLKRFYQKCVIVSARRNAIKTWMTFQDYTDEELNQASEEQLAQYNSVQLKFIQYQSDQEAQRLAKERERQLLEAERLRLEEERKLKYQSYVARGIEGYRQLYYEKLDGIAVARIFDEKEFYFGGNVLLRWRTDELIETSKNIIVTIPQAKSIFKMVSRWHNDPSKFKESPIQTNSGKYRANQYKDDILTAGCHDIAYCEMERMHNQILQKESITI